MQKPFRVFTEGPAAYFSGITVTVVVVVAMKNSVDNIIKSL